MDQASAELRVVVVGIDDTDMPGVGGTGRLARGMAAELIGVGLGSTLGVTRHQLFEGPGVPKTSRNSAAAWALTTSADTSNLIRAVAAVVERDSIEGSDPGIAVAWGPCPPAALEYARHAQSMLVEQATARLIAADHGIHLSGHGGTEDGVIGALSAAMLRLDGNDGRYVDLPGIRSVSGEIGVADLLARTGISSVVDAVSGEPLAESDKIDVADWVRPRLVAGRPILVAARRGEGWVNADRRSR